MFVNFIKSSLRNIRKFWKYSLINLLGLILGMIICLCLISLIRYELSYDVFRRDAHRIYRIVDRSSSRTQANLSDALAEMFPEVEQVGRIMYFEGFIRIEDAIFQNQRIYFADPEIMDIFSISDAQGYDEEYFKGPFSLLITRKAAHQYFGTEDPVGKTIVFRNDLEFHVQGIIDTPPENTHFRYDFIASMSSLKSIYGENILSDWDNRNFFTYIKLKENVKEEDLTSKLPGLNEKYNLERPEYHLQLLKKIHVSGNLQADMDVNTDMSYVNILIVILLFIILMVCFNYINLATAQSLKREKEIGLRKVLGSSPKEIRRFFITESLLISYVSMMLSVILFYIFLPGIRRFWDRPLSFNIYKDAISAAILFGLPLLIGLFSGFIPALRFSRFSSLHLGGKNVTISGKAKLRSGLIVLQFVITNILLITTLTIDAQLKYLTKESSKVYGEQVVFIDLNDPDLRLNYLPFTNALKEDPRILELTASFNLPYSITSGSWCTWPGQEEDERFIIRQSRVEKNFVDFYQINIVDGRNFSLDFITDKENAVLINETAARLMGGKDIIGRRISTSTLFKDAEVIGIMEDFHFKPMHQEIEPLVLTLIKETGQFAGVRHVAIKIEPGHTWEVLSFISKCWNTFSPDYPLQYGFLNDRIEVLYQQEIKIGEGIRVLTLIQIIIACSGLYGLSLFSAEQKTRDIGIRKVHGASVYDIFSRHVHELIKWVLIAILFAIPISYFTMNWWLRGFAYHINLSIKPFLLGSVVTIIIALFGMSYQAIKAAISNPVDSLRYE